MNRRLPDCKAVYWPAVLAGLVLAGCSTGPRAPPGETPASVPATVRQSAAAAWELRYAALAADGGDVLRLDPQRSTVRIRVFRGGRAARLGHNHVLAAPEYTGYVFLPAAGAAGAQFDLEFRLDRLTLDDPQTRATLGPAYAAELTPGDIANTRAHMLGPDNLQADRYPFVRIHSGRITGEGTVYAADIAVELHGHTRTQTVALTVEALPHAIKASGAFVLRQSDFGVQPYAALGGLIAVQDEVLVEFTLAGG